MVAVDSGGDPLVIPSLTFEQFRSFHSDYYHPSNSRIFFYGDDDVNTRLEVLDEYLREFDYKDIDSKVDVQPKTLSPQYITQPFPLSAGTEPRHTITVNWLLNEEHLTSKV